MTPAKDPDPAQDSGLRTQDSGLGTQDLLFQHPPFTIHFFNMIVSTQQLARAEVRNGRDMRGIVLWAGAQTAGHGRTGRKWSSEPGGIYVTACLPQGAIAPALVGWLPLMAALACAEEIEARFGLKPQIKWPNDVLIDNRKVSGVIGDAMPSPHGEVYLIGMGVNWENSVSEVGIPACAIKDFLGPMGSMEIMRSKVPINPMIPTIPIPPTPQRDFLIAWLDRLGRTHRALVERGEIAAEELRRDAEARLWRRSQTVRFERTEAGAIEGVLLGLGAGGSVIIQESGQPPRPVYCGNATDTDSTPLP